MFPDKLVRKLNYIAEFTLGRNSAHLFKVRRKIASVNTPYQVADFVELFEYGKTLFLDGKLQVSEVDEFVYHETIVHPALLTHPNPKKVLVIGGADGGTLRQVLKHKTVKEVTVIELDEKLLEACRKFLPEINKGAFKNKKVKIFYGDGRKFIEETNEKFDAIISDLVAPMISPPSYLLFTKEFFQIVFNKLNKDGVFSQQTDGASTIDCQNFALIYRTVAKVFPISRPLLTYVSFYDCPWGFVIASKKYDPLKLEQSEIKKRIRERGLSGLGFYDEKIHQSLFFFPKNLLVKFDKQKNIITDKSPLISET